MLQNRRAEDTLLLGQQQAQQALAKVRGLTLLAHRQLDQSLRRGDEQGKREHQALWQVLFKHRKDSGLEFHRNCWLPSPGTQLLRGLLQENPQAVQTVWSRQGELLQVATHGGEKVRVPLPPESARQGVHIREPWLARPPPFEPSHEARSRAGFLDAESALGGLLQDVPVDTLWSALKKAADDDTLEDSEDVLRRVHDDLHELRQRTRLRRNPQLALTPKAERKADRLKLLAWWDDQVGSRPPSLEEALGNLCGDVPYELVLRALKGARAKHEEPAMVLEMTLNDVQQYRRLKRFAARKTSEA